MPEYTPLYTKIWGDSKFKSLSKDGMILFLYLCANESITLTGIYELDIEVCKIRSRAAENFKILIAELSGKKMIEWDEKEFIVWIINRFKFIPTKSPKVIAGAIDELNLINHPFKNKFIEKYKDILSPYLYRLNGYKLKQEEILTEDFIFNASKLYTSRNSLKNFLMNKNIPEVKIDGVIAKILPNLR